MSEIRLGRQTCGTPSTAVSSGDVFLKFRRDTLSGKTEDAGWAEWSVSRLSDAHDPELWYETNPSLGTILTERKIRSELGDDQVDDNIQRLGLWLQYSQKSAISREEWLRYAVSEKPKLKTGAKLYFGVKFSKTTGNVSLAIMPKNAARILSSSGMLRWMQEREHHIRSLTAKSENLTKNLATGCAFLVTHTARRQK